MILSHGEAITIESCSWMDFFSVAYTSWYYWNCGRTQRKAANINQICMPQLQPLCSAALVLNVLPRRDEGSGKPCAVIEASYYIGPATQDSNPGGQIQNDKRWSQAVTTTLPLHIMSLKYVFEFELFEFSMFESWKFRSTTLLQMKYFKQSKTEDTRYFIRKKWQWRRKRWRLFMPKKRRSLDTSIWWSVWWGRSSMLEFYQSAFRGMRQISYSFSS